MNCPKCAAEMLADAPLPDFLSLVKAIHRCPNCEGMVKVSFGDDNSFNPFAKPDEDRVLAALREKNAKLVAERSQEESEFCAAMDFINHSDSPFAEKQAKASAHMQAYPDCQYRYRASLLQDALDSTNPAYIGLGKYKTCGMTFYTDKFVGDELLELDGETWQWHVYIDTATGIRHIIDYMLSESGTAIFIDGMIAWQGDSKEKPFERGENLLLVKLGALF
jgi:hypothetical protein